MAKRGRPSKSKGKPVEAAPAESEAVAAEEVAAAPAVVEDDASPTSTTNTSTSTTTTPADIVRVKEAFTAPFMIYDAAARRIVPNPAYNRLLLPEVRRLQSITLTRLRTPLQAHLSYTPKELLYELEATLYCIVASAAVQSGDEPLRHFTSDAEADTAMPQLESFLAHHNAPAKAAMAVAYCLTEGTSHDMLTKYMAMLQERIDAELDPAIHRRRTEAEQSAVRATKNNVSDMAQLMRDLATAYHSIDTPSQVQRRQPQSDPAMVDVARSPAANSVPAKMVEESFYKVLRWVLAVDADRRALRAAAASTQAVPAAEASHAAVGYSAVDSAVAAAVAAATTDAATAAAAPPAATATGGFAHVTDYDPFTGRVTLERAAETQRWGLLLNAKGLLVGLENELRNSSEAGERLYDAVQQESGAAGGLAIYEVNRRRIRAVHLTEEELADSQAEMMGKLRAALTQPTKVLNLSLEKRKQADLTSPHEVLYEVSYQGGEGGVGQRCLLMLERASTSITWGLKLKYQTGAPALLSDFAPNVRLSAAAKNFLFDMRGRVRVVKMNNKELAKLSAVELKELVSGAMVLTLNLQVTDEHGQVPEIEEADEEKAEEMEEVEEEKEDVTEREAHDGEAEAGDLLDEARPAGRAADQQLEDAEDAVPEALVEDAAAFDDVAEAIANEFLLQTAKEEKDEGEAKEVETTNAESAQAAVASVESFEELDWAHPTTTIGAPGDIDKDEDINDDDAEPAPQLTDDDTAEQRAAANLLRESNLLPDDMEEAKVVEEAEGAEAVEAATDAATGDEFKKGGRATANKKAEKKLKKAKVKGKGKKTSGGKKKTAGVDAPEEEEEGEGEDAGEEGETLKAGDVEQHGDEASKEVPKAPDAPQVTDDATADAEVQLAEEVEDAPAKSSSSSGSKKQKTQQQRGKKAAEEKLTSRSTKKRGQKSASSSDSADAQEASAAAGEEEREEAHSSDKHMADGDGAADADGDDNAEGGLTGQLASKSLAVDVPLVDLPPTAAELAMEQGKKGAAQKEGKAKKAKGRDTKAKTKKGEDADAEAPEGSETNEMAAADREEPQQQQELSSSPADEASAPRVSLTELLNASPLTFENNVTLEKFDGSTLQLGRTAVSSPWNIKVAFAGDEIIMTKLPPIAQDTVAHPFLRSLGAGPQGEVKWVVEGLNGQDLSMMSKPMKTKALDAIKSATKLSFALKALRK